MTELDVVPALDTLVDEQQELYDELAAGFSRRSEIVLWCHRASVRTLGQLPDGFAVELLTDRYRVASLLDDDHDREQLTDFAPDRERAELERLVIGDDELLEGCRAAMRLLGQQAVEYVTDDGLETVGPQRYVAMRPALHDLVTRQRSALEDALGRGDPAGLETHEDVSRWVRAVIRATKGLDGGISTRATWSLEVTVTTAARARGEAVACNGSGAERNPRCTSPELALVLSDDVNHDGRTVAVPVAALEDGLGYVPEIAYGLHEDGSRWMSPIQRRGSLLVFDVPKFSSNTVTFAGTVEITATPAVNGSSYQYGLEDVDAVDNFTINVTGSTSIAVGGGAKVTVGNSLFIVFAAGLVAALWFVSQQFGSGTISTRLLFVSELALIGLLALETLSPASLVGGFAAGIVEFFGAAGSGLATAMPLAIIGAVAVIYLWLRNRGKPEQKVTFELGGGQE